MRELARVEVNTAYGGKGISVLCGDIRDLDRPLDVMGVSSFVRAYYPLPGTLIGALQDKGISVAGLAAAPEVDLRDLCGVWLSGETAGATLPIRRICCVEMLDLTVVRSGAQQRQDLALLNKIKAFFHLLDLAADAGLCVRNVGLPMIGTGNQRIADALVITPVLNECMLSLERNESIREISIIERSFEKAEKIAQYLENSYSLRRGALAGTPPAAETARPLAFISYSGKDRNVADNLCAKMEAAGIPVWYAPRNVDRDDYASAIVQAIERSTIFVVILSQNSLGSEHVLNEIDLAFQGRKRGMRFYPLKLDHEEMGPSFKYYLSRQHWMDATLPPLEKRLDEFVAKVKTELEE